DSFAPRPVHVRQRLEARAGEQIALEQIDAQAAQRQVLLDALDTFGDHRNVELAADTDDAFDNRAACAALVDIADQFHVDLDDVWLKLCQQTQPRIASPEVVDRGLEAKLLVLEH